MKTYTLKPLVWAADGPGYYQAKTVLGHYLAWKNSQGSWYLESPTPELRAEFISAKAAKAAAEAHYRERILTALEVVG